MLFTSIDEDTKSSPRKDDRTLLRSASWQSTLVEEKSNKGEIVAGEADREREVGAEMTGCETRSECLGRRFETGSESREHTVDRTIILVAV